MPPTQRKPTNKIPDVEDQQIYKQYLILNETMTPNQAVLQIAREHEPKRTKETIERAVARMEGKKEESIIERAGARIAKGQAFDFYSDPGVQMMAMEVLAKSLCNSKYKVGEKQFKVASMVADEMKRKDRGRKPERNLPK